MRSNLNKYYHFPKNYRTLEFGFSNFSQILSGNAIPTQLFFTRGFYLEIEISITFLYEKQNLINDPIFERTDRALEFGFSNVLQIISANGICRNQFFSRGFFFEFEISITFFYEKQY